MTEASDKSKNNLWIVTNYSGMKQLIDKVSESVLEEHPGVTITVDIGPDVFLFLSENVSSSSLIIDVNQSIRNGLFLDITEYYDRDTELNKDGFVSAVMDADLEALAEEIIQELEWHLAEG